MKRPRRVSLFLAGVLAASGCGVVGPRAPDRGDARPVVVLHVTNQLAPHADPAAQELHAEAVGTLIRALADDLRWAGWVPRQSQERIDGAPHPDAYFVDLTIESLHQGNSLVASAAGAARVLTLHQFKTPLLVRSAAKGRCRISYALFRGDVRVSAGVQEGSSSSGWERAIELACRPLAERLSDEARASEAR
ncbi:MAG: hypothetical protein KIT58_15405 [Planctomycetota bacterium]|nr:hypothetical protein [Planctomycetota bacterium]